MTTAVKYCTFLLDGHRFGIEVGRVQEVIRSLPVTRVPLAHAVFSGLINLRGQVVLGMDLRARLDLPPRTAGRLPVNLILRTEEGPLSLLVDEIGDVLELGADSFERPPETLKGPARNLILGAHKLADRLVLILDVDRVIHLDEAAVSAETEEEA